MLLNSTDGAPATDAGDHLLMEPDLFDNILLCKTILTGGYITFENGHHVLNENSFPATYSDTGLYNPFFTTEDFTAEFEYGFIITETGESIVLEDGNAEGASNFILFETGSQDADGVLKIRVNGEDKYIQLYDAPGEGGTSY